MFLIYGLLNVLLTLDAFLLAFACCSAGSVEDFRAECRFTRGCEEGRRSDVDHHQETGQMVESLTTSFTCSPLFLTLILCYLFFFFRLGWRQHVTQDSYWHQWRRLRRRGMFSTHLLILPMLNYFFLDGWRPSGNSEDVDEKGSALYMSPWACLGFDSSTITCSASSRSCSPRIWSMAFDSIVKAWFDVAAADKSLATSIWGAIVEGAKVGL